MKRLLLFTLVLTTSNFINAQGWGQIQKLVPADREINEYFGQSLAVDGDYAVVGAYQSNEPSGLMGSAYIFKKDPNGNWIEHQKLTSSDGRQFDQFGESVDIDGNFIIIGARGQDYDESNINFENAAGAAYIFEKDGTDDWNETQKIVSSDRGATFQSVFGKTVAISGNYAVGNSARENTGLDGQEDLSNAGACYIFERDGNGFWTEVQKIVSSDRDANERWGEFALDISGNTIVVGTVNEKLDELGENELDFAGAVYIFERDNNGLWNEVQKIVNSDREFGDTFGRSVAIDGNYIIVGADFEDAMGDASGAAYVFERNVNGVWTENQKLTALSGGTDTRFGQRVDINGDKAIIGSWSRNLGGISNGGAAFIFEKDNADFWNETAVIYDLEASNNDQFGFSVAISDIYGFVSANQEDEDENNQNTLDEAGSVFVFDINEPNNLPPLTTLSIAENDFETILNVHPNPVENVLNLELNSNYDTVEIHLYNMLGQEVFFKKYSNSRNIQVEFDNQSKGLYIVELVCENQIRSRVKVIKQ